MTKSIIIHIIDTGNAISIPGTDIRELVKGSPRSTSNRGQCTVLHRMEGNHHVKMLWSVKGKGLE